MIEVTLPLKTVGGLNAERLNEIFSYDEDSGQVYRKYKTGPNVVMGRPAGWVDRQGYRRVRVDGVSASTHRVVWTMIYGVPPEGNIDHINGVRSDNRIGNLRDVSHSVNLQNQRSARSDNKLGIQGVRLLSGKYQARIWVAEKNISIGMFKTAEEASSAYREAKRELHEGCTI